MQTRTPVEECLRVIPVRLGRLLCLLLRPSVAYVLLASIHHLMDKVHARLAALELLRANCI